MAAKRYWRIVGITPLGGDDLELSEVRIYEAGVVADTGATLTATAAPSSGSVSTLQNGDTSTAAVWPREAHSQPSFALVWDFGSGGGVESPRLRLGSSDKSACFPLALTLQYSTDALSWYTLENVTNILDPGNWSLTALVSGVTDEFASNIVINLRANGADGSTTFVDDTGRHLMTATGGAQISTAQSVSGTSSAYLPNNGGLYTDSSDDFDFGAADFTVECMAYPLNATGGSYLHGSNYQILICRSQLGAVENGSFNVALRNGKPSCVLFRNNNSNPGFVESTTAIASNQWSHLEYSRSGGTIYLFINGSLAASTSISGGTDSSTRPFTIGVDSAGVAPFQGYIDNVRVTKGVCRHTSSFTPPTDTWASVSTIPRETPLLPRFRNKSSTPDLFRQDTPQPPASAAMHLREHTFFDAYNGGLGTITGTVKEKNTPANTPLRRRVLLIDEASRMTIRETWSDPVTGAFEFRGIKQGVKYSTISYDHLHNYRAVIADNQDAA